MLGTAIGVAGVGNKHGWCDNARCSGPVLNDLRTPFSVAGLIRHGSMRSFNYTYALLTLTRKHLLVRLLSRQIVEVAVVGEVVRGAHVARGRSKDIAFPPWAGPKVLGTNRVLCGSSLPLSARTVMPSPRELARGRDRPFLMPDHALRVSG